MMMMIAVVVAKCAQSNLSVFTRQKIHSRAIPAQAGTNSCQNRNSALLRLLSSLQSIINSPSSSSTSTTTTATTTHITTIATTSPTSTTTTATTSTAPTVSSFSSSSSCFGLICAVSLGDSCPSHVVRVQ